MDRQIKRRSKIPLFGWMLLLVFSTSLALSIGGIQYTQYVDNKSRVELRQAMCPIFTLSLEAVKQQPIVNESQRKYVERYIEEMTRLVDKFECNKFKVGR